MKKIRFIIAFIIIGINMASGQTNTREISKNRIIVPYNIEVCFDKTVHIIFPDRVEYIDLGSANIIAGKADAAENVVRVKAAVRDFEDETNFSVITAAGDFYSFNVSYASRPDKPSFEMKDFTHRNNISDLPNNRQEVYLTDLDSESSKTINLIMETIYKKNKREVKHIDSKKFGIKCDLKSIYCHSNVLYFNIELKNKTHLSYDIDLMTFKIADKKVTRRTAIQETIVKPVKAFNDVTVINGKSKEHMVYAFEKFTIPDDKVLIVELFEKNGGRHQRFVVKNAELVKAREIDKLRCHCCN